MILFSHKLTACGFFILGLIIFKPQVYAQRKQIQS